MSASSSVFARSQLPRPTAVSASGSWVTDAEGNQYLDAAGGAIASVIGHGDATVARAMAAQATTLEWVHASAFTTDPMERYAEAVAGLVPMDRARVFPVSGGSEAVESAWKLARQYYAARGQQRIRAAIAPAGTEAPTRVDEAQAIPSSTQRRWKAVSRHVAYHGTTMGALSINGIPALREPFEPLVPEVVLPGGSGDEEGDEVPSAGRTFRVEGITTPEDWTALAGWWRDHRIMPTDVRLLHRSLEDVFLEVAP